MAAPTDKRASELTAPVSIEDTDTFPGYRPGTGGEPNLDIRATAGLIRAPIIAGLAAGNVSVGAAGVVLADGTTAEDKLAEFPSIMDAQFGATGNGVADDSAALIAFAAAAGGRLPAGTYKVSAATAFSIGNCCLLEGAGVSQTIIEISAPTNNGNVLNISGDYVSLRNLTIRITPDATNTSVAIYWSGNHLSMTDVVIDGTMTDNGTINNHKVHGLRTAATATQTGLYMTRVTFDGCQSCFLKTNTDTSILTLVRIRDCLFRGTYSGEIGFNSPLGSISDVIIDGNKITNPKSIPATASSRLGISASSVKDIAITNNVVEGTIAQAIHLEENCGRVVITGNRGLVNGSAIRILDNNISGSPYTPTNLVISGNVFTKTGAATGAVGLSFVWDASGYEPIKDSIASANVMSGFEQGYLLGQTKDGGVIVEGNTAIDCAQGYYVLVGGPGVKGNTSIRCAIGVVGNNATINDHLYIDCTATARKDPNQTNARVMQSGFRWKQTSITPTSSGVNSAEFIKLGANDRLFGHLNLTLQGGSSNTTYASMRHVADLKWDGATLTNVSTMNYTAGSQTVSLANASGVGVLTATDPGNSGIVATVSGTFVGICVQI